MTNEEARLLPMGLYLLRWKEGGESLAAVGQLYDGRRWFAPVNWTSQARTGIAYDEWSMVTSATAIVTQAEMVDLREGRDVEPERASRKYGMPEGWWSHKVDCRCESCKVHA